MKTVSRKVFEKIFAHKPIHDKNRVTPSKTSSRLMSPDYEGFLLEQRDRWTELESYDFEEFTLTARDGLRLKGFMHRTPGATRTFVFLHGLGTSAFEGAAFAGLAFIKNGYNLFIPDGRACGRSEGAYITFGILEREDLVDWLNLLTDKYPDDLFFVHGISFGGCTVELLASMDLPSSVRALSEESGFAYTKKEVGHAISQVVGLPVGFMASLVDRHFKKETGLSLDMSKPLESVRNAKHPIMFINGLRDVYVPPWNAQIMYDACPAPKDLYLIEGAGHVAGIRFAKQEYVDKLTAFHNRFC